MIDWLTIVIALVIIITLVGFFGFLAWKISMSDPLTIDDNHQHMDSLNDKKRKEKNIAEQGKKKRKDQKKAKRETKDDEQLRTTSKGRTLQTSEETDDEREESEQESLKVQQQAGETSSKARKRNKNKTSLTQTESNVTHEKNPTTTRVPPVTHPKSTSKDELQSNKQQTKVQVKSSQVPSKQTLPVPATTTNKKTTQSVEDQQQEQPFTVVGGNRHKNGTPSLQQQQQQQQNKPQAQTTVTVTPLPVAPMQQSSSAQAQHDQLGQRQQAPQKQAPVQASSSTTNSVPVKQQSQQQQTSKASPKIADLIKVLPSSQVAVTELMSALDAFPLSTAELDIIMQKIANKQSVIKQDWSKLQLGQKVDPQAHIGQVMDDSGKAYVDDVKNNSMKRIKELTDELNTEKRRSNDLLKEKTDKEREIQILHAQLDSVQHKSESTQVHQPQQQKLATLQVQLKRMTEENMHLNQQLAQQQSLTTSNVNNNNTGDALNVKVQVLSDQIKKLSVDNANWEKKAHSNEVLAKEAQKEKDDLIRYNEQLTQSLQNAEKELKSIEEKHHKQLNESRTTHMNEINETKRRIEQLESENEQLRREEIVHVEPTSPTHIQTLTVNNEEREQFEKDIHQLKQAIDLHQQNEHQYEDSKQKLTAEVEQYKKKIDEIQQERNNVQQEADESRNNELNAVRSELEQVKSTLSQSQEHLRQEREKQRKMLADLLTEDVRKQLPHDNQDFDQWFSSYRQLVETNKHNFQEESATLKRENEQLHKNMNDIENHLKAIEQTVQSKEEALFTELKSKDDLVESIRGENDQLTGEIEHLRNEIQRLQSMHDISVSEMRALKSQLDEKFLLAASSPPVIADESFELVKQPSPSLSPIVIDIRAEQLNELIRSSKEALENQDSITQQLDKHLNDRHPNGQGETTDVNESTVSSSSDQQS